MGSLYVLPTLGAMVMSTSGRATSATWCWRCDSVR
jgi:hypothetical protein